MAQAAAQKLFKLGLDALLRPKSIAIVVRAGNGGVVAVDLRVVRRT